MKFFILLCLLGFFTAISNALDLTKSCECGEVRTLRTRIINGQPVPIASQPWFAALYNHSGDADEEFRYPFCGGALINNEFVLTAAHCVYNKRLTRLQIGFNIYTYSEYIPARKIFPVKEVFVHPRYDDHPKNPRADIALVRLQKPVEYGYFVKPICLPGKEQMNFTRLTAVGWGRTSRSGGRPLKLQMAELPQDDESCVNWYNETFIKDHLCARDKKSVGWSDVCNGDSGGPLVATVPNSDGNGFHAVIAGTVSYSTCLGIPAAVFSRVSAYLDWIDQHTKGTKFCAIS